MLQRQPPVVAEGVVVGDPLRTGGKPGFLEGPGDPRVDLPEMGRVRALQKELGHHPVAETHRVLVLHRHQDAPAQQAPDGGPRSGHQPFEQGDGNGFPAGGHHRQGLHLGPGKLREP